jgi:hypothetical protein
MNLGSGVRFQVLTAASMMFRAGVRELVEFGRRHASLYRGR